MSQPATPPSLPSWTELRAIARHQRFVLWAFLAGLAAFPLAAGLAALGRGVLPGEATVVVTVLVIISTRVAMAIGVHRLTTAMGSKLGLVWAIGAFIPNVIGLIVLVVVSLRASSRLKKAGLKVGLMGANLPEEPPPGFASRELGDVFS
jgi:hypothetical protein